MIKELTALANHLDSKGLVKEADAVDSLIQKFSGTKLKDILFPKKKKEEGPFTCSKQSSDGRKIEVVDSTKWTDKIIADVTGSWGFGPHWGGNNFAYDLCNELENLMLAGMYGNNRQKSLYEGWNQIHNGEKIKISVSNGVTTFEEIKLSEHRSKRHLQELVAHVIKMIEGEEDELNRLAADLKYEIFISREGAIAEMSA